jgi:hypothetical protein
MDLQLSKAHRTCRDRSPGYIHRQLQIEKYGSAIEDAAHPPVVSEEPEANTCDSTRQKYGLRFCTQQCPVPHSLVQTCTCAARV